MKRRRPYLFLALGMLVLVSIWVLLRPYAPIPRSPVAVQATDAKPSPIFTGKPSKEILQNKVSQGEQAIQERDKAFSMAFLTPISFWGKVVDEKGNPVSEALVKLGTADRPWETGSSYTRTTDANGLFSITGVRGLSISINVSKDGYYQTQHSRGQLSYAQPSGNKEPLPVSGKPMVFELRKMGETVPLIRVSERPIRVPKNGTPVEVNFSTGQAMAAGQNGLKVECWTEDQNKNAQSQYTWRCRLSVPGGGLVERTGQFSFEAPPDGYKDVVEIEMPQSSSAWAKGADKDYFAKLPGDRYARFTFGLTTGGDHFFVVASYLNPTPGNRNLEFDPTKVVKSP